jgi:hypothetical protein
MENVNAILVPVSAGELIDKITILRIKASRMTDLDKLNNVRQELAQLEAIAWRALPQSSHSGALAAKLANVNSQLWQVEDDIRKCEGCGDFGPRFVELARTVYRLNDARAEWKRSINIQSGSSLIEEKQYVPYASKSER